MFDVGALLEDAETKNAALERVEELEENISHVSASQEKVPWGQDQPTVVGMECRNEQLLGWRAFRFSLGPLKKEGMFLTGETLPLFPLTFLFRFSQVTCTGNGSWASRGAGWLAL